MTDVVTFGETMIRLFSPDHLRLEQTTALNLSAGGAELNGAAGTARLGHSSAYVSRLPSNPFGRLIANKANHVPPMYITTARILPSPGFSPGGDHRVLKLVRTIADLARYGKSLLPS